MDSYRQRVKFTTDNVCANSGPKGPHGQLVRVHSGLTVASTHQLGGHSGGKVAPGLVNFMRCL